MANDNHDEASLELELAQVESGLSSSRGYINGRAMFNSIQSSLASIRDRFESSTRNLTLQSRLERAELAHSERVPLHVVQEQEENSSNVRALNPEPSMRLKDLRQSVVKEDGGGRRFSLLQPPGRPRSQSIVFASRLLADEAQGIEMELENFVGSSSVLKFPQDVDEPISDSKPISEDTCAAPEVLLEVEHKVPVKSSTTTAIYSWGSVGEASLHDDDDPRTIPTQVSNDSRLGRAPPIQSVSVGATHTACVTIQGDVLICGRNDDGQVDPERREDAVVKRPVLCEALLGLQTTISKVSCGGYHTAALTKNGSVLTWGSDKEGQLGHRLSSAAQSSQSQKTFCRPKAMFLASDLASDVACGENFTLVLTTRMSVFACGGDIISNREVATLPTLEGLPIVSIAAGKKHAAVVTIHGAVFAWGDNPTSCCGRPFPNTLSTPSPIHLETDLVAPASQNSPFPNWSTWNNNDTPTTLSLADDIAVVDAACGGNHTVLVTKSGRLLLCGSNAHGQCGFPADQDIVCPAKAIHHPTAGRHFVTAAAGECHTLALDDVGDVWHVGDGKHSLNSVLCGQQISMMAAGGKHSVAVGGTPKVSTTLDGGTMVQYLEDLLEELSSEDKTGIATKLSQQIADLLKSPTLLNCVFLAPDKLHQVYTRLISIEDSKIQQTIFQSMEKGIIFGCEKLRSARMLYPEAVGCLLSYIQFISPPPSEEIAFDLAGNASAALCEAILGLPFEGYKALMKWAPAIYHNRKLFVTMLVQPLMGQLENSLAGTIDQDGVEHVPRSRRVAPMLVAVLRWFEKIARRDDRDHPLATPEDFYCQAISKLETRDIYEDLQKYKSATKNERASRFFFSANPFLIEPGMKRNLLKIESEMEMVKTITQNVSIDEDSGEYKVEPFFALEVDREKLLEETLDKIRAAKPTDLCRKLRIIFKGEEGLDAGGVTKEFFQLLSEELFDVNSSLWCNRYGSEITWFNSDCTWDEEGFELVGVLVGLALYNGVLLDVRFPMAVYRKLLSLPLGLEDMVDEELKQGLKLLLNYEGDDVEDVFCLNFEVTWMALGKEQTIELKPNGSEIPVTSENKEEYVLLYVSWLLVDSIESQWGAFEKGIMKVMENASFDIFSPEELKLLVVGTPDLDFKALESNTSYEGGFDENSMVVRNFWRFIHEADRETQLKFLKFATGSSMAPIGGLGELNFLIQRAGPDSPQLPTSHTCFNTLLLPDYGDDYEKLKTRLGRAVLECEGFGLE
mmetsp:Transcript_10135/g.14873  ORF Transcript_10135/g.14873 Transcript_10135/m.14873 type:complete len:1244 (-) Transcript_10135:1334-5065(-)